MTIPRLPEKKKKRILNSISFKKWKKARLASNAPPKIKRKDALRAYQIDKSLKAEESDKDYWKKIPQRSDIVTVDKGKETWNRNKKYYKKQKR